MKKITYLVLTAVTLLIATPAKAQFCWGIKGGVSLGNPVDQPLKLDNYAGFFIGPKAEARIPVVGLGIEGAVLYAQRFKQDCIQIPVNVKYSFGIGNKANLFLAVGPEFGFNAGKTDDTYYMTKSSFELNAGLGVTLLKRVQVAANYNMPWKDKLYYQSGSLQFSLAYLF